MDLSLSSRFKNAWNAFRNRAPTMMSQNIGSGYSYRPDRFSPYQRKRKIDSHVRIQ